MDVAIAIIVGYLLGTFPSADLVTRIATRGQVDIRTVGSGNPGAFNAIQSVGTGWGGVVLVLDVAKGAAAGVVGRLVGSDVGAYLGATAAIAGHIFPAWTGFRGGKGVATSAGTCLAVFPAYVPINFVVAMLGALGSHRAEVGTRIGCAIWVGAAVAWWVFGWSNLWGPDPTGWLVVFSALGAGMILWAFGMSRSSVTITMDVVDYCRVVAERIAPDECGATLEGDTEFGLMVLACASALATLSPSTRRGTTPALP